MRCLTAFIFLAPLLSAGLVHAQDPWPSRAGGFVMDHAKVIEPTILPQVHLLLETLEKTHGHEVIVYTSNDLGGTTVEDAAERIFNQWGIGKKDKDNGILVLVSPKLRKMRIEVGYGLESEITDGIAGQLIQNSFLPQFKNNQYGLGILQGVQDLTARLRGETKEFVEPELDAQAAIATQGRKFMLEDLGTAFFLGLFAILGMGAFAFAIARKEIFFMIWGSGFGGIPLLFSLTQEHPLAKIITLLLALFGVMLGWKLARKSERGIKVLEGAGWTWASGTGRSGSSSGGFSGGFGGGGSSSGGFSSGGGSSGGGGASGSW